MTLGYGDTCGYGVVTVALAITPNYAFSYKAKMWLVLGDVCSPPIPLFDCPDRRGGGVCSTMEDHARRWGTAWFEPGARCGDCRGKIRVKYPKMRDFLIRPQPSGHNMSAAQPPPNARTKTALGVNRARKTVQVHLFHHRSLRCRPIIPPSPAVLSSQVYGEPEATMFTVTNTERHTG